MCARGDGDFWGKSKGLTTGYTEEHREESERRFSLSNSVYPVVTSFGGSDPKLAHWRHICHQGSSSREKERHHRAGRGRPENLAHRPSCRRQGQRSLHRIFCKTFEGAAFLRYYCSRRDEPE